MPTKTLKVTAHWTDGPPVSGQTPLPSSPFPTSFNSYPPPANLLPKMSYQPKWPGSGPVSDPVVVWCELVRQVDIPLNWSDGTLLAPPPPKDEGYAATAVDFRVTEVALVHFANPGTDFVFTIASPTGAFTATITPTGPGRYPVAVPNLEGKGIWSITINRQAASSAAAPSLLLQGPGTGPPPVNVPYVIPYVGQNEGILVLEFTGDEVECPTTKSIKGEKQVGATWVTITGATCVDVGQKVRLTADYTNPAPPSGTAYEWNFGDAGAQPPNTFHPTNSQEHTYAGAGLFATAVSLKLGGCSTLLTKAINVCWNCPTTVTLTPTTSGCAPTSGAVLLDVVVTWPPGPTPTSITYNWIVNGPTGKFELDTQVSSVSSSNPLWRKTSASPMTTGPLDLSQPGTYSAAVALQVDNMKSGTGCALGDTKYFQIEGCSPCPTPQFTASPVQGCAPGSAVATLSVQLTWSPPTVNPPGAVGYKWTITDPSGTRQASVTTTGATVKTDSSSPPWTGTLATATGTVDLDTPGQYQVEVEALFGSGLVFDTSCSRKGNANFNVPACCPTVNSLTATPSSGTPPLNVNLQANVTNPGAIVPDASGNLYHWTFGDGAAADTVPSSTAHTYSSTGSFTAEVKVNAPASCPPTSATATITAGKKTNGDGLLCGALLIAWMLLFVVGSLLLTVGIVNSNTGLIYAGAIVLVVAVIVFIIWLVVCRPTICEVLKWLFVANFAVMLILGFLAGCNTQYLIPALIWVAIVLGLLIWILIRCACDVLHWVALLLTIAVALYVGYYALAVSIFAQLAGLTTIPGWLAAAFKFLSSCPPNKIVMAAVTSVWATAAIFWLLRRCWRELDLKE